MAHHKPRKRKVNMRRAKPARAYNRKRRINAKHRRRTHNPVVRTRTRTVYRNKKRRNPSRRSRNPFGVNLSSKQIGEIVLGASLSAPFVKAATSAVANVLPSIATDNVTATIAAAVIGLGGWYLGSLVSKDFGFGVGIGALSATLTQAVNSFVPSVGNTLGLSGFRRGVGDFVPGRFTVPQNPVLDAARMLSAGSGPQSSAYPTPYTRRAA